MELILKVDLSKQEITKFEIPEQWEKEYLGGASLAARLLYDTITPELDPLSPEAVLLFMNGPLSGTSGPTVGRYVVCGKSPATHLWGESNCGGFWGVELRKAGFSGVWVTGRAESPVYLWINNGEIEIRSAEKLWGLDTYDVQTAIQQELGRGGIRVAGIGIAGENLNSYACILSDHGRVAGRTGLGAVMGSKNLKAIAVSGNKKIAVQNPGSYAAIRSSANKNLRNDNISSILREIGSGSASDYFDYLGSMPKKGFTQGTMEGIEKVYGTTVSETYLDGVSACHACVIACGRVLKVNDTKIKGPEYETLVGFGANLLVDDPEFIINMNDLCDRYGMDTISTSNTLAFAFRLFEMGIISEKDTNGMKLVWGNTDVIERLVHQIAHREGFGAILGEGSRAVGERFGAVELAVQVNGLEVAYHDPRGVSGMALVYATSPRGACHNQSDYFYVDIGQVDETLGLEFYDRHGGAEKAKNVVIHQNWRTVFNSLVMCIFGNVAPEEVVALINAGCGLDWDIEEMLKCGERGWNLKRAINNRLGLRRENDKLPKTLLEALPDGGAAGFEIDFLPMLKAYYEAREWDWTTGFPKREKLEGLGLEFAANDLWGA